MVFQFNVLRERMVCGCIDVKKKKNQFYDEEVVGLNLSVVF